MTFPPEGGSAYLAGTKEISHKNAQKAQEEGPVAQISAITDRGYRAARIGRFLIVAGVGDPGILEILIWATGPEENNQIIFLCFLCLFVATLKFLNIELGRRRQRNHAYSSPTNR